MTSRLWILGAPDPEMEAIEAVLRSDGERYGYAVAGGTRVHSGNAYRAAAVQWAGDPPMAGVDTVWYLVECAVTVSDIHLVEVIDHHRPGDPGFGRPPAEYWTASSLGQVCAVLGILILDTEAQCTAAADHCLGAAYADRCPGVDSKKLATYRTEARAKQQGRTVEAVQADIDAAQKLLRSASEVCLLGISDMPHTEDHDWSRSVCDGCAREEVWVADMRNASPIPELPEAATRLGISYLSGPLIGPDGRKKYTVSGTPVEVRAFFDWAEREDLVDAYGDPERGFAGAYEP